MHPALLPIQKHLILLGAAHDVEHDVRLHLEHDHLLVVQYDVGGLLGCLLCPLVRLCSPANGRLARTQQSLLESLLVLHRLVCLLAGEVGMHAGRGVRIRVVLGEDARAIVNGEDEDGLDAEEGQRARHGC